MTMSQQEINRYKNEWQKNNKKRFPLLLSHELFDQIKAAATAAGYDSLNAYINDAISEKMARKP